jgi:hypothetical protein
LRAAVAALAAGAVTMAGGKRCSGARGAMAILSPPAVAALWPVKTNSAGTDTETDMASSVSGAGAAALTVNLSTAEFASQMPDAVTMTAAPRATRMPFEKIARSPMRLSRADAA